MPPCDIYARVFENAQTGLLLLERDTGRILEVNAAFLRMAGRGCWAPPLVADVDAGGRDTRALAGRRHGHGRGVAAPGRRRAPVAAGSERQRGERPNPVGGAGCHRARTGATRRTL